MAKSFSRNEILERLHRTINEGKPILAAGCSAGIIAKCAEMGGADLIVVYSTGLSRLKGLQTTLIPNSNAITLEMFGEIQDVVNNTPIIAGVEATEPPAGKDLVALAKKFIDMGYSGIQNFPTIGFFPPRSEFRMEKEAQGLGFSREVEMIKIARKMDIFTMAYVFYPSDAAAMVRAGVDCLVPHAGGTAGGVAGYDAVPHKDAAARIQRMIKAAERVKTDVICLAHGGPFATPEDTQYLYEHTDAVGFEGASAIERIPIEKAIKLAVLEFKSIPIHPRKSQSET